MTWVVPIICPACGAQNEPDSNFCDQCSEVLQEPSQGALPEEAKADRGGRIINVLVWTTISSLILVSMFGATYISHYGRAGTRPTKLDWHWMMMANIHDAQSITGQALPAMAELDDVKSYERIHELSFLDPKSLEWIMVFLADSRPKMTPEEMMTAWKVYTKKIMAQPKPSSEKNKWSGWGLPSIVGQKILRLTSGELLVQQIQVAIPKQEMADGMQAHLMQRGKSYYVLGYGKPFTESAFIEFLDEWQSAPTIPPSQLSPEQLSTAYTKRGKWLERVAVRRQDAVADFQKALQLDPNNSEARARLETLRQTR